MSKPATYYVALTAYPNGSPLGWVELDGDSLSDEARAELARVQTICGLSKTIPVLCASDADGTRVELEADALAATAPDAVLERLRSVERAIHLRWLEILEGRTPAPAPQEITVTQVFDARSLGDAADRVCKAVEAEVRETLGSWYPTSRVAVRVVAGDASSLDVGGDGDLVTLEVVRSAVQSGRERATR